MKITIKHNFPEVQRKLDALQRETRFATAVALTRTAQDVKTAIRSEMQRAFDRPTRFTLNSLFLRPATKTRLEATVHIKDSERPTHYLHPQIDGGARPQKRFEELLRQRGILSSDERTVPGKGARLDSFGSMGRGQIVQILSQLGAFNLAGSTQNASNSKRSRRKRALLKYFVARRGEERHGRVQHLRSGIYAKTLTGISPVLIFVKHAEYQKRLRFYEVGRKTDQRITPAHRAALDRLEQERHRRALLAVAGFARCHLEIRRHRRLEVGDEPRPDQLRCARRISRRKDIERRFGIEA